MLHRYQKLMFLPSFIHDEKTEDEHVLRKEVMEDEIDLKKEVMEDETDLKKEVMDDETDLKKEVMEDETDLKKEADVLNREEQVEATEAIELSPREEEAPSETTPLTNDSLENKQ
jgi:hypothetical protein